MEHWLIWALITCALVVGEVVTGGFFLLALVPGALFALAATALDAAMGVQILLFGMGSLASLFSLRPVFVKHFLKSGAKTGTEALIGKYAQATQAIAPGAPGRAQLGGEDWRAQSENRLNPGDRAPVLKIEGATLILGESINQQDKETL